MTDRIDLGLKAAASDCVSSVTEELAGIDGVQSVTINSSAPISSSTVRVAVEEAGYALADASV